eukprot:3281297-Pyramimonas_sp.AAC.1
MESRMLDAEGRNFALMDIGGHAGRWRSQFCAGGCWRSTSAGGDGKLDVGRWKLNFFVGG